MVYRLGWMDVPRQHLKSLLGFRLQGASLVLDPCIPRGWRGFEMVFRYRSARYNIVVENPLGVCRGILASTLDDEMLAGDKKCVVALVDDGATHQVRVVLG